MPLDNKRNPPELVLQHVHHPTLQWLLQAPSKGIHTSTFGLQSIVRIRCSMSPIEGISKSNLHSLFCNTFTHLHITMAFASMKQDCPHNCIWFIGHCHDQMFYLLQMANVSQKVNRASIVFHYCRILKCELI